MTKIPIFSYPVFIGIIRRSCGERATAASSVSRHHGCPIEGPPETLRTIAAVYGIEGLKEDPLLGPPLSRETLFSRIATVIFIKNRSKLVAKFRLILERMKSLVILVRMESI